MATDPRDWRQLAEAGSGVAAFLDLDEMLRRVVSYVSESSATDASSILLHDPETAGWSWRRRVEGPAKICVDAVFQTAPALQALC
jgi:hypothetical protein